MLPPRILCVGRYQAAVETRCAVLAHNGYLCFGATINGSIDHLDVTNYDLVILPACLAGEDGGRLLAGVRTILTEGTMLPLELLKAVSEKLDQTASSL